MIKTFEKFGEDAFAKTPSASERYEVQKDLHNKLMNKIQELVGKNLSNVENPDWGHVGSFASMNENLIDIIEGWDEDLADEFRKVSKFDK